VKTAGRAEPGTSTSSRDTAQRPQSDPGRVEDRPAGQDAAAGRDQRRPKALLVVSVAAAVAPILIAAVRAVGRGWYPAGDDGFAAVRARDVLSAHPPLLGTWSSASLWSHHSINHPGPAQFDVLALPVRLLGPAAGVAVGTALTNALCVAVIAWLAYRRGGVRLGVAAALLIATLSWAMGSELLYDPWSQFAPLFPFTVFVFAVWGIADGDVVAMPVAVLAGSFALQTHLSYVLLVPGLAIWAVIGHWLALRRLGRDAPSRRPATRARSLRWLLLSVGLLALCWAQPLYEQVSSHPGNLSELAASSRAKPPTTPGLHGAIQAVGDVVALPPMWLPPGWAHPAFHIDGSGRPEVLAAAALVAILGVGGWLAWLATRRRDQRTSTALISAGVAVIAALASTARSTSPYGLQATYVRWLWPISLFVWLALALGAAPLLRAAISNRASRRREPLADGRRRPSRVLVGGVVATAVVAALTVPTRDHGNASPAWAIPVAKQLFGHALPDLRDKGPLLLELPPTQPAFDVGPALMTQLQTHGIAFRVRQVFGDKVLVRQVGEDRRWDGHNARVSLVVAGGSQAAHPAAGTRRLAFYAGLDRRGRAELARLSARLKKRIHDVGGAHLSPVGRDLRRRHRFPSNLRQAVDASADDPSRLLAGDVPRNLQRFGLINIDELGQNDFTRYVNLHDESDHHTAALLLAPLPD